jgi:hypothetical protein
MRILGYIILISVVKIFTKEGKQRLVAMNMLLVSAEPQKLRLISKRNKEKLSPWK